MTDLTTKAAEIRAGLVDELRRHCEFDMSPSRTESMSRAAALIEQQAAELAAKERARTPQEVRELFDGMLADFEREQTKRKAAEAERAEHLATIARLEGERDEAREKAEKSERGELFTHQWYAQRLEPIKDVAKRVGVWDEVAAIIANGSGTRQLPDGSYNYEPPAYAQQLNGARHKAEAAERRATTAESTIATQSERIAALEALARKLSDALLTVRPLGGSELFMRVGEAFFADPAVCEAEIGRLRADLHETKAALVRERRARALTEGGAEHGPECGR